MQKTKEVVFYLDRNKKNHVADWLNKLNNKAKARISIRLDRLEYGVYGDRKSLANQLYELRFFFDNGYRVYFAEDTDNVIRLLCAGSKDTQRKDVKLALSLLKELKNEV
jgi:putative addiction module killer protein